MIDLEQRYFSVRQRISTTAQQLKQDQPCLLAVSKKHPADAIRVLFQLGQRQFGENYWQEAEEKMQQLQDLDIEWHFIGPLQSNKTRAVAANFAWVHSVDREKIAQRLSDQRPAGLAPLNVCLQVNIDDEDSKSGVTPEQLLPLARKISGLPRLSLRGLMCIPRAGNDPAQQQRAFQRLAQLQADMKSELRGSDCAVDTLSMGMSADLEPAIAAGSTLVRIGTALFGDRQKNVTNPS
ncbi:MAG: YggS family pyridoxal phosphate-dependent enzyme [Ketobacter sp.]|nr:MAG: YggS family pyridoxal phosphate-dependent enzyme [Ketobacter sp.]